MQFLRLLLSILILFLKQSIVLSGIDNPEIFERMQKIDRETSKVVVKNVIEQVNSKPFEGVHSNSLSIASASCVFTLNPVKFTLNIRFFHILQMIKQFKK